MDEQNPQAMILDALKQMGVPQEKINMPGVANLVNQYRLSTGKLQPGQAERVARLGAAGQENTDPTLLGGAKAVGSSLLGGLKAVPQAVGDVGKMAALGAATSPDEQLVAKKRFDEGLADLLGMGKSMATAPIQFGKGLANEIRSPETVTQQDVNQTVGAGMGTLGDIGLAAGGLKALGKPGVTGGIDPAAARAAQLASDLKWNKDAQTTGAGGGSVDVPGLVRGVGNTPTYARRGGTIENVPFAPEQSALRLNQGAPAPAGPAMGITPKFEEDAMPRAYEPTPASPYPAAGGYHPEMEQLFKDVLGPAKEEAPQQGAGFQALKQTRRAKARLGNYRQSEDDTGGQPS